MWIYTCPTMRSSREANLILQHCREKYGAVEGFLHFDTPFQLLVAVILSAQTTDEQVNRCTPDLFRQFPDAHALSRADPERIEKLIQSTGYFRVKTRHVIGAAKAVDERFGGVVPQTMEELVTLPGVGRKSAGVVLHHVFGLPAIIVDTHFGRVSHRLGFTASDDPVTIEKDLAGQFPTEDWGDVSMLLNLHGRRTCHARKPHCAGCFLLDLCPAAIIPQRHS